MIDGIGQKLEEGNIVVRCGFNQYAQVILYKVVKLSSAKITIALLSFDIKEKTISTKLDRMKEEIRCSVYPHAVVKIGSILHNEGYTIKE